MTKKSNIIYLRPTNLENLLYYVNESFSNWPNYIFRGHAQSDWLLEPTLSRTLKKINHQDKKELIDEHLLRFKLEIRGRRGLNPRQLDDNELWALGQHYGLHTPLLDWTQSPYVALFFALADPKPSPTGYRALWGFHCTDTNEINDWYKEKFPKTPKYQVELLNPILDENSRLVNQNGLFTKISLGNDIESWISNGPDIEWITLYKIEFPETLRDKAICYLDLMNINYSSLFPDLVGSSMNSNVKLEQTDYIRKLQEENWKEFDDNK